MIVIPLSPTPPKTHRGQHEDTADYTHEKKRPKCVYHCEL